MSCVIEGCARTGAANTRGMCRTHYDNSDRRAWGLPHPIRCTVEGCTEGARARGLCRLHYERLRFHGDPNYVPKPFTGPTHGKAGTYRGGCRCRPCCEANTLYARSEQAKRKQRLLDDPTLAPHGRLSTYGNWGCRCAECFAVHAEYMRSPHFKAIEAKSIAKRRAERVIAA